MNIPIAKILHGEQQFVYHKQIFAGDRIRLKTRVTDIYEKKGGALEFVRRETTVTNQHGALVAELTCVTVVRHG